MLLKRIALYPFTHCLTDYTSFSEILMTINVLVHSSPLVAWTQTHKDGLQKLVKNSTTLVELHGIHRVGRARDGSSRGLLVWCSTGSRRAIALDILNGEDVDPGASHHLGVY